MSGTGQEGGEEKGGRSKKACGVGVGVGESCGGVGAVGGPATWRASQGQAHRQPARD